MEPIETEHGKMAFVFASALVSGDFSAAHDMLSEHQRKEWSPSSLKDEYDDMIEYGDGPVNHVEVMNEMVDWPTKEQDDIGWAYAAMSGDGFSEAVSVVVCIENNQHKIREIEWGRP